MKIQVVTSWNNKLFKEYAHRFQSTYNWPFDLIVYNEDDDMFDKIPDLKKFIERNQHRKVKSFKDDGVRFNEKQIFDNPTDRWVMQKTDDYS